MCVIAEPDVASPGRLTVSIIKWDKVQSLETRGGSVAGI
jgi:hypothetical protein